MSESLARLSCLDACSVSDTLDKLSLAGAVFGLAPLSTRRRICGNVVTTRLGPPHPGLPKRHLGAAAIMAAGVDEAREFDLPLYARGAVPLTARGRVAEHSFNERITIANVIVSPGDYAIADARGIAFIAQAEAERVIAAAEEIVAREALMAVRSATTSTTWRQDTWS